MAVVYVVECVANGFAYVGCSSAKLNRRMNEHMSLLRKGKHSAAKMLEDWRIYGRDGFVLKVVERLPDKAPVEQRREAELKWMRHYESMGKLYNAVVASFEPSGNWREKAHTPEANLKRRLAQLGKPKGHGAKISATKKARGQRPTLEAARQGAFACHKARYGKN
jgi:group I intron endonuclease